MFLLSLLLLEETSNTVRTTRGKRFHPGKTPRARVTNKRERNSEDDRDAVGRTSNVHLQHQRRLGTVGNLVIKLRVPNRLQNYVQVITPQGYI